MASSVYLPWLIAGHVESVVNVSVKLNRIDREIYNGYIFEFCYCEEGLF